MVVRLRKVVGARLVTRAPGYLRVDPSELDAARFAELVEQAGLTDPERLVAQRLPPLYGSGGQSEALGTRASSNPPNGCPAQRATTRPDASTSRWSATRESSHR